MLPDPGNGIRLRQPRPGRLHLRSRASKELHFDPGHVDDVFDQDTTYAVSTVQKYFGLPPHRVIDKRRRLRADALHATRRQEPKSEPDRVEIDLDKQVLTLYTNWQPQPADHHLDRERRTLLRRGRRLPVRDHAAPGTSTSTT